MATSRNLQFPIRLIWVFPLLPDLQQESGEMAEQFFHTMTSQANWVQMVCKRPQPLPSIRWPSIWSSYLSSYPWDLRNVSRNCIKRVEERGHRNTDPDQTHMIAIPVNSNAEVSKLHLSRYFKVDGKQRSWLPFLQKAEYALCRSDTWRISSVVRAAES